MNIKAELLKEHVLTACKGLTTSEMLNLIKELGVLQKDRTKQAVASIAQEDWDRLMHLFEPLSRQIQVKFKTEVECQVGICRDNVAETEVRPYLLPTIRGYNGDYSSSFEVEDHLFTDEFLLSQPGVLEKYEESRILMTEFNVLLKTVAQKYNLDSEIIWEHLDSLL